MASYTHTNINDDYSIECFETETGLVYQQNMETYRQWKLTKLIHITSKTMASLNKVTDKIQQACNHHKHGH